MSDVDRKIDRVVSEVSERIQKTWPLYGFVTSNPLAGFEDQSFNRALEEARELFGGHGYPAANQFRQAYENGSIDPDRLQSKLRTLGYEKTPDALLRLLEEAEDPVGQRRSVDTADKRVNQMLEKWLSVFLDEGRSRWEMPRREQGFYASWTWLAPNDQFLDQPRALRDLPRDPYRALERVFSEVDEDRWEDVVSFHLTALPGWVGYIKHCSDRPEGDGWSDRYPITLIDYLAVRLMIARQLDATVVPDPPEVRRSEDDLDTLRHGFLEAWEETYQENLLSKLRTSSEDDPRDEASPRPDAQLVFCIDTRSEIIRRHIEARGNYETHGYAGFFGLPVRRRRYGGSTFEDACPPIVEPRHVVGEQPAQNARDQAEQRLRLMDLTSKAKKTLKNLKDNIATAFPFVEFSGLYYGLGMIGRTLWPGLFTRAIKSALPEAWTEHEHVFQPDLDSDQTSANGSLKQGLDLEDKVAYARSAFDMMGWETFAPVVVFAGHVSDTVNNPFDSSLRCGACAGRSGVPNARMLASICNERPVREALREEGIDLPEDTIFVAGRHNTTTDEITLFDRQLDPDRRHGELDELKRDLKSAQRAATAERMNQMPDAGPDQSVREVKIRSSDWAQTRPEWGLAGNASFVVGPTELRSEIDLGGRAFLHSYNWREDDDGTLLEQIMAGPVIVCQWINHQYYFSTVDNGIYGSGSKITQNPVGNFGVMQGNGGDLMGGLPLQSLMSSDTELQHAPLRITNVIHAPEGRVRDILNRRDKLRTLVENNWIHLLIMDPRADNDIVRYAPSPDDPS